MHIRVLPSHAATSIGLDGTSSVKRSLCVSAEHLLDSYSALGSEAIFSQSRHTRSLTATVRSPTVHFWQQQDVSTNSEA